MHSNAHACRIVVLVSNPGTTDSRASKMARTARAAGLSVTVFGVAGPDTEASEDVDGIRYVRLPWVGWREVAGQRLPRLLSKLMPRATEFACKAWFMAWRYRLFARRFAGPVARAKPSIIHAHDLICLPAACIAARSCGAAVVYDAHEYEVGRYPPLPWPVRLHVAWVERRWARRAARVLTVGQHIAQCLGKSLRRSDIEVLYNSPQIQPCADSLRKRTGLTMTQPLLVYVGKVTVGRGLDQAIGVLTRLPEVHLALLGPSDPKVAAELMAKAEGLGVRARCWVLGSVPADQVVSFIRDADIGLMSVQPLSTSYRFSMPNKLFELALSGVPILCNTLPEAGDLVVRFGLGEVTDFDNPEGLEASIRRMLHDPDRYRSSGSVRQEMLEEFGWTAQGAKLVAVYRRLCCQLDGTPNTPTVNGNGLLRS